MRIEDIFILPNRKSDAIVLHHPTQPIQGIHAKCIIWEGKDYAAERRFVCQQAGEAVLLGIGISSYLIQEQPDGAIRLDELDKDGVPATTTTYLPDQAWYFVLEAGLRKVDFPGFETFNQPVQA